MTKTRLDWEPVARSLVLHLVDHDVIPVAVYDGAYTTRITRASASKMADQVAEIACGVDEATLRCIWYTSTSQLRCSLVLVFGNEPDEVVADYTWENCDGALEYAVEFALEDFRTEWGRQGLSVRLSRFLNASHLLQFSALLENAKS